MRNIPSDIYRHSCGARITGDFMQHERCPECDKDLPPELYCYLENAYAHSNRLLHLIAHYTILCIIFPLLVILATLLFFISADIALLPFILIAILWCTLALPLIFMRARAKADREFPPMERPNLSS